MNPLGTTDDKVARLEALLKRVQVNAAALRNERANGEAIAAPLSLTPISDSPGSGSPVTAPTGTVPPREAIGTLPGFPEQSGVAVDTAQELESALSLESVELDALPLDANEPITQIPGPPVLLDPTPPAFQPVLAEPEVPLDSLESDLPTLPPSRDDDFQDPNTEHTKPLWLGLDNGTGTFRSEGGYETREGDAHRTLAETPAAKVYDTQVGFSTGEIPVENTIGIDTNLETDLEVPAMEDSAMEHSAMHSATASEGVAAPGDQAFVPATFDTGVGEEERLDTSPPISGHRPSSRTPELTPELTTEDLEQELEMSPTFVDDSGGRISDAPPSVLGATITLPEESSEVALELLEPPPSSFRSNQPAPDDELEAELPRTSFRAEYDASLSSPPSAAEDLRAHDRAEQERKSVEKRVSRSPERVAVGEVSNDDLPPVLSSRPASPSGVGSLVYAPEREAIGAVFDGERPPLRGMGFLELLDASLSIEAQ